MNRERERCVAIIDKHLPYAESLDDGRPANGAPGAAGMLWRIRNMIANGARPMDFREQLMEMIAPPKKRSPRRRQ